MRWNKASCFESAAMSTETEIATWSKFQNEGKAIAEQILESEERNKSRRAGPSESQQGLNWLFVNHSLKKQGKDFRVSWVVFVIFFEISQMIKKIIKKQQYIKTCSS